MCGLWVHARPPYTIYRLTSYLRLLALSVLTCSLNMSFLARLVSDYSRSLETFELGHCPPQLPRRKNFYMGYEFLFMATYALDLTFLAPLTSDI